MYQAFEVAVLTEFDEVVASEESRFSYPTALNAQCRKGDGAMSSLW